LVGALKLQENPFARGRLVYPEVFTVPSDPPPVSGLFARRVMRVPGMRQSHWLPLGIVIGRIHGILEMRLDVAGDSILALERAEFAGAMRLPLKQPSGVEILAGSTGRPGIEQTGGSQRE
jgi:hypothetical protein